MAKKEYWSASRIDTANYCMMRYFLKYIDPIKPKPLRLSAYAKGGLLHKLIEHFWTKLGTQEQFEKDKKSKKNASERKKYYDANSFGEYAKKSWIRIMIMNRNSKNPSNKIYWRDGYDNDSEGWGISEQMPKICSALYSELIKEGPPIESELKFYFEAEGLKFLGFIDEVRLRDGKAVIRDYKSGSPWGIKEMKRDFDPQLTFYNAGLCSLLYGDSKKNIEFAKLLGLQDFKGEFLLNNLHINPNIEQEFFMVEAPYIIQLANASPPKAPVVPSIDRALKDFELMEDYIRDYGDYRENLGIFKEKKERLKNLPKIIHSTSRTETHFQNLVSNIMNTKNSIEQGQISFEHGKKCDLCDMRISCRKRACELTIKPKDRKGNLLFDFMEPSYTNLQTKNTNKFEDLSQLTNQLENKPIENEPKAIQRKIDWRGKR